MKVLTYSNVANKELDNLLYSANKFEVDLTVLGYGELYAGHISKLRAVRNYLLKAQKDIYVFTDGHDSFFVRHNDVLADWLYFNYNGGIIMSAERACNPYPIFDRIYPKCNSSFKYLNSGGWIADRDSMLDMLEDMHIDRHLNYHTNDQGLISAYFLSNEGTIVLDTQCEVFQCLYQICDTIDYNKQKGVFNKETCSYPIVLHGNGRADLTKGLAFLSGDK